MSDFDGQSTGGTGSAFERRWEVFQDAAQTTEGPLGNLFQTIAWQHQRYCEAAEHNHVTMAESARMIQIVQAAMVASEWLRSNESDGSVVEIRLQELIQDIADQTTAEHVLPESGGRHQRPEPPECEVA